MESLSINCKMLVPKAEHRSLYRKKNSQIYIYRSSKLGCVPRQFVLYTLNLQVTGYQEVENSGAYFCTDDIFFMSMVGLKYLITVCEYDKLLK